MGIHFSRPQQQTPATDQNVTTPKQEARQSCGGLTGRHKFPIFHAAMHKAMSDPPRSPKLCEAVKPTTPPESSVR